MAKYLITNPWFDGRELHRASSDTPIQIELPASETPSLNWQPMDKEAQDCLRKTGEAKLKARAEKLKRMAQLERGEIVLEDREILTAERPLVEAPVAKKIDDRVSPAKVARSALRISDRE